MEALTDYFDYTFMTLYNISKFTLNGTHDDWITLREKVLKFLDIYPDLSWWIDSAVEMLDIFISAYSGTTDLKFWESRSPIR